MDDFIQEELGDKGLHKKNNTFDDNVALTRRNKGKEKKDLSKMKCFSCGEYGDYLTKCLRKKKGYNEKKKGKEIAMFLLLLSWVTSQEG